jgi:hypothetical protein
VEVERWKALESVGRREMERDGLRDMEREIESWKERDGDDSNFYGVFIEFLYLF